MSWFFFSLVTFALPLSKMIFPPESGKDRQIYEMHLDYLIFDKEEHSLAVSIHLTFVYFSIMCVHASMNCLSLVIFEHSYGLLTVVW